MSFRAMELIRFPYLSVLCSVRRGEEAAEPGGPDKDPHVRQVKAGHILSPDSRKVSC